MSGFAHATLELVFLAAVGAVSLVVFLWPKVRRLRKSQCEHDELQRENDRLVRENQDRAREILEGWKPPEASA